MRIPDWQFDTPYLKERTAESSTAKPKRDWRATQSTSLIRYVPSGLYFARFRIAGKLIRKKLIGPLLAERDPGAKYCLRDNRRTFRSAFTPEAYVEFEQLVNNVESHAA
jgi:hypothetical protein